MVVARTGNVDAAKLLLKARRQRERDGAVARADGADVGGGAEPAGDGASCSIQPAPTSTPAPRARLAAAGHRRAAPKDMNRGGLTPLLYAAREGCVECARELREGRRRHRSRRSRRHHAAAHGADEHALRPRRVPDRGGRGRQQVGLLRPDAAVCGRRHEHAAARRPARSAVPRQTTRLRSSSCCSPRAPIRIRSSSCARRSATSATIAASTVLTTGATPLLRAAKAAMRRRRAAAEAQGAHRHCRTQTA